MEHPGMSIFRGSEALQLDTSLQHLEEDEAEEDQKRRNMELQDILTNAFDDLIDDDDLSTINSTCHSSTVLEEDTNRPLTSTKQQPPDNDLEESVCRRYSELEPTEVSEHYQYCFRNMPYEDSNRNIPYEDSNQQYRKAEYGSMEQLEVLYEVRVREVQQLAQQIEELKKQAAQDKDQLRRQLALINAEKERAVLQNSQSMKTVISSRERVSELEKELGTLRLNLVNVQQSNSKLSRELDAAHISVKDLEEKVSLLERGNVANRETLVRGVRERHEKEIIGLRSQIESLTAKFNAKDTECDGLRQRLTDLSRTHEALLVEKTDTINQLMVNLEESQHQCQKLVAKMDVGQIFAKKEQLEKYVHHLKMDADALHSDLPCYEEVPESGLLGAHDLDSSRMDPKSQPSYDQTIKLRNAMQRCQAILQIQHDQIDQLKDQLQERDKVIQTMRQQEAVYLSQAESFKKETVGLLEQLHKYQAAEGSLEDVLKLRSNITELQSELTAVKADRCRLEGELVILRQSNVEEKLRAIDQHSEEYVQWHDQAVARIRQEANEKIQALNTNFNIQLREAQKEADEVKQLYIEVCSSKEKLLAALECEQKAKKDLSTLSDIAENLRKTLAELQTQHQKLTQLLTLPHSTEVEELRQALYIEKEKVQALEVDLQAARERDNRYAVTVTEEIEKAKMEALQELKFSSKQTHPDVVDRACSPLRDKAGEEEVARVVATLEVKHQEHLEQVKQESVRCLAVELSACDARYQKQLEQAEEEYSRNLAAFRDLINSKTQEVEALKQAMLMKRDKPKDECENSQVTEELAICTKEVERLKEQLQSCDKEWQKRLTVEADRWQAILAEHQQDVETEQAKMAEAVAGWAEELQTQRKQHQEAEIKLLEMQEKYKAAKKIARRYKLWADGKEQHINREWQRITIGFQNAFQVLHDKAEAALAFIDGDGAVTKQLDELDEQMQELKEKLVQETPS